MPAHARHLVRRFVTSWSSRPVSAHDRQWVGEQLLSHEMELWSRHGAADQRHTVAVARSFAARRPLASRAEVAGALLHDIGKVDVGLSIPGRVVARLVGPRTPRLRDYLDHERIGAERLAALGSDPVTVELVAGHGPAFADLFAADNAA